MRSSWLPVCLLLNAPVALLLLPLLILLRFFKDFFYDFFLFGALWVVNFPLLIIFMARFGLAYEQLLCLVKFL